MRLRTMLVALGAMSAFVAWTHYPAHARETIARYQFDVVNCSYFKGKKGVCLFNRSDEQVVGIDCDGHIWGSRGLELPPGGIPAHSLTIVDMAGCTTSLTYTLLTGEQRRTGKVNTNEAIVLEVPGASAAQQ